MAGYKSLKIKSVFLSFDLTWKVSEKFTCDLKAVQKGLFPASSSSNLQAFLLLHLAYFNACHSFLVLGFAQNLVAGQDLFCTYMTTFKKRTNQIIKYGLQLVRVPNPLPKELGKETNVFKSRKFFFSGFHISKFPFDTLISTVRCSIPHPTRISIHPIRPLIAPRCYIRL